MSISILTITGLNLAIALNKEIVQVFKRDFSKTFFMLKKDFLVGKADPSSRNDLIGIGAVSKMFDNKAYAKFKQNQFDRYGAAELLAKYNMLIVEYVARMYKGIQIVEKHEDVFPDFYSYELPTSDEGNKFQPEHFLVGTQVTVSPELARMYWDHLYPSVFTVEGIRQNGPNGFVLTTSTDDMSGLVPGEKYCFNISHVENIVSQGKGVIKIDPWKQIGANEILKFADASKSNPEYAKKNHWLTYGDCNRLVFAIAGMPDIPRGAVLNTGGLMWLLLEQSFVQKIQMGRGNWDFALYSINKKRAKRFVKQNLNRFLSSAKKEQQQHDDEMERYYRKEMDLDSDLDSRYPCPVTSEKHVHDDLVLDERYSPFDEKVNRFSVFDLDGSSFED